MATLEAFDREVKEVVGSGKLSASKVKGITQAAMANIAHDAHLVATLFKCHKQAKPANKLSSLYIIDAVAREARSQVKKGRDKGKSPQQDNDNDDDSDAEFGSKKSKPRGTYASFLKKIESFLDRLVSEVLTKGPPEHKEKVRKVPDIWSNSPTFSDGTMTIAYARLNGESSTAHSLDRSKDKNAEKRTDAKAIERSTTPPYPPPQLPITFPPLPLLPASFGLQNGSANASALSLLDSLQSSQLASLLALQQATSSSSLPPPSNVPYALDQPAVHRLTACISTPAAAPFQADQLALLQQLVTQTGSNPPFPQAQASSFGAPPPSSFQPPHVPQPGPSNFATDFPGNQGASQGSQENWQAGNHRDERNNRQREDRPERNGGRKWDRRSQSPPRRQRGGNHTNNNGAPPMDDRRNEARPRELQSISAYITEEVDDNPGRNFRMNQKRERDAAQRQVFDSSEVSDFVVPVAENQARKEKESFNQQDGGGGQGGNEVNGSGNQGNQQSQAQPTAQQNKPFDPSTFNPFDPDSWAGFANICSQTMGYMPSNQEMLQFFMNSMQMMQQMSNMNSMNPQMGMTGMQGMQQNMHNQQSMAHGPAQKQQPQREPSEDLGPIQPELEAPASPDEGEGEADMDMNDD